jgi:hypothetical protein
VKSLLLALALGLALALPTPLASASPSAHVMLNPVQVKWGEPPPALPKGAKFAVIAGDPGAAGPFTIRLRLPAGYRISPHWHPTDENVTVISGTFSLGMGEKFDRASTTTLSAGGYAVLPGEMRHFAWTRGGATVQVHGTGPFVLNYVNAADDPRQPAAAK